MNPTVLSVTPGEINNQVKLPTWISLSDTLLVHKGDAHIPGDLNIDWNNGQDSHNFVQLLSEWFGIKVQSNDSKIKGLVILGNLVVEGSIINADCDSGPCLIVKGDVKAKNLVCGGSFIEIYSNAIIDDVVFCHYNHGELIIRGQLETKVLINDDHGISIENFCRNQDISQSKNNKPSNKYIYISSDDINNEDDKTIPTCLKNVLSQKILSWSKVEASLFAGQNILRTEEDSPPTTIEEWVLLIWESPGLLRKLPRELRTESFYLELLSHRCPMTKPDIADLFSKLPKKALTLDVRVAALELAPKSLLQLPLSYDLQKEYDECFKLVKDPHTVFNDIPDQFKSDAILQRLTK
jgi:hypothetical protein